MLSQILTKIIEKVVAVVNMSTSIIKVVKILVITAIKVRV
jgi:hypothetical protein